MTYASKCRQLDRYCEDEARMAAEKLDMPTWARLPVVRERPPPDASLADLGLPPPAGRLVLDRFHRWTPEEVIERGLGPREVKRILSAQGWQVLTNRDDDYLLDTVALRGGDLVEVCDRHTTTRKREAKHLSEALGGRYDYSRPGFSPPSDWAECIAPKTKASKRSPSIAH